MVEILEYVNPHTYENTIFAIQDSISPPSFSDVAEIPDTVPRPKKFADPFFLLDNLDPKITVLDSESEGTVDSLSPSPKITPVI